MKSKLKSHRKHTVWLNIYALIHETKESTPEIVLKLDRNHAINVKSICPRLTSGKQITDRLINN